MTRTKAPTPLRSGWCGLKNPDSSHRQCSGHVEEHPCPCECHSAPAGEEVSPEAPVASVVDPSSAGPRVVDGMPEAEYHAHPALSASGAKLLLPPSCPAKFKALRGVQVFKDTFDFGKAAHSRVLGVGEPTIVVQTTAKDGTKAEAENYNTKSAQQHRDEIRAGAGVPVLASQNSVIDAMARSLAAHDIARALFTNGKPEQSAFWTDTETGVACRARFDWLPEPVEGRRLIIPDLKTAASAEPGEFARNAARFHYAMQDQWYCDAATALGLADDPVFLFVVIEKEEPYLVTVAELVEPDKLLARRLNQRARRTYAECTAADTWPGYTDGIAALSLPAWYGWQYDTQETA